MSRLIDEGMLLNVWQLNSSKILNLFSGLKKKLFIRARIHKMPVGIANWEDPDQTAFSEAV